MLPLSRRHEAAKVKKMLSVGFWNTSMKVGQLGYVYCIIKMLMPTIETRVQGSLFQASLLSALNGI